MPPASDYPAYLAPLLAHIAQATLFGFVIGLVLIALPRADARLRYGLGWLGLARFVLPLSLLGFILPTPAAQVFSGEWLPTLIVSEHKLQAPVGVGIFTRGWMAVALIWAIGTASLLILHSWRAWRCARRLHASRESFSPAMSTRLTALAGRMELPPGRISGWATASDIAPGVFGLFRSRIHVPRELLSVLTHDETEAVLLHELAHVARHDNLWRLVQTFIVCFGWFHPLVWWLHRRLVLESERACDEIVVRLTSDRETYVHGLFKAARFALGLAAPGFAGMARHGLKTRFVALLNPTHKKDHPMLRSVLLLCALAGFVATSGTAATEADPNASETELYGVAKLDVTPYPVFQARPHYPPEMAKAKIDGEVVVSFIVDKSGVVKNATVVRSTRPEFEASALESVSQWKFKPGIKGGRPVNTKLTVPIVYTMNRK